MLIARPNRAALGQEVRPRTFNDIHLELCRQLMSLRPSRSIFNLTLHQRGNKNYPGRNVRGRERTAPIGKFADFFVFFGQCVLFSHRVFQFWPFLKCRSLCEKCRDVKVLARQGTAFNLIGFARHDGFSIFFFCECGSKKAITVSKDGIIHF